MSEETASPEYRLILNATDGSLVSEKATRNAVYLAKATGAQLLILHVVETNFAWYTAPSISRLWMSYGTSGRRSLSARREWRRRRM